MRRSHLTLIYAELLSSYTEFLYISFYRKVKRNVDFIGVLFYLFVHTKIRVKFFKRIIDFRFVKQIIPI